MNSNDTIGIKLYTDAARFSAGLRGAERDVQHFSSTSQREIKAAERAGQSLARTLAGLGIGAVVSANVVMAARMDKSLIQIGQTAGISSAEVDNLRKELFRMAGESGQNVNDLKDGFNNAVQAGLNLKEALPVLDAVNTAMSVTGANANTLTSGLTVAATAFNFDLSNPGQALKMLDQMTIAGRLGNAELQSLSDIFAKVGPGAATAGLGFEKTLAFIEGLSTIEKQPERLATLADSTLRLFTNQKYMMAAANATGVKFFNADSSRRDPLAVLKDLKKEYDKLADDKAKFKFMSNAFGKADLDTVKGLRTLFGGDVLNKISGKFTSDITNASGTLKKDMQDALNNSVDQVGRLKSVMREAADGMVKPINEMITNTIRWGLDKKEKGGLELDGKDMLVGGASLALGTYTAAKLGGKGFGALAGKFGSVGAGVATGKALEEAAGVTPVYVVNMPDGGIGGVAGIPGLGKEALKKSAPWLGRLGAGAGALMSTAALGTAAGVGYAGLAGYGVGTALNKGGEWAAKGTRMEGVGTDVIGGAIAKTLAFFGNEDAKQAVALNEKLKNAEVGGSITIKIDADGRARVGEMKPSNPNVNFNIDSGYSMLGA